MPDNDAPWKTVQVGVLVEDSGEKLRTIQHWSDLGILRPERVSDKKGRGNYRIYRAEPLYGERTYALLASAFAKLRLPLGDIRHLIYAERLMHDPVELLDKNDPHLEVALLHRAELIEDQKKYPGFVEPFEAALAGEPDVYAVVAARPHDRMTPFDTAFLRQAGGDKWVDPDLPARANNKLLLNLMRDNSTAVILNLSKIFEPLRRPLNETDFIGEGGRAGRAAETA
jgi:DNA-binding transcriptional MerR regulator